MKRIAYFIVTVSCFLCSATMAQTIKQKVAVYVTGDAEAGYKKVIGSKMVSRITNSDSYAAVERTSDFLAALTKEQDYQTSGAVSDNQIVRLGQQFGVRYVLVADVSEVFESMFISVRMIDVQTGQITGATEASAVVNSMEELTELSEKVSDNLILGNIMSDYANGMNISRVKIIGPFAYPEFYNFKSHIPKGYRVTSKTEIEALITAYKKARKLMVFPIHAGVSVTVDDFRHFQKFTSTFYESEDKDAVEINLYDRYGIGTNAIPAGYIYLVAD